MENPAEETTNGTEYVVCDELPDVSEEGADEEPKNADADHPRDEAVDVIGNDVAH